MISRKDLIGGVTTFLTMSYILVVNPQILSSPGTGMSSFGVLTATVLLSFSMSLLMGLYARLPFAVAPGMGINAFFAYSLIIGQHIPWQTALAMVFWAGVIFLLISVTPLRERLARSITPHLKIASAVGIGIFLAEIGFKNVGLIPSHIVLTTLGLMVTAFLMRMKNPLAIVLGIAIPTLGGALIGLVQKPLQFFSEPDFHSVLFKLDIFSALKLSLIPSILSIMLTDLFDSISTFVGVSTATGLVDQKGNPLRLKEGLLVDAFATLTAGLFGTSSGTAYLESAAGIEAGGRSGQSAVVTALCFLPCLFIAPIVGMVPAFATAPALILIGALMVRQVREIKVRSFEERIPALLTVLLIPLTFSITEGMLWGFASHVVLFTIKGRFREILRTKS